ncbi:MAG: metallophosphoesterase family protein [Nitrososphaeraceae archaeon]
MVIKKNINVVDSNGSTLFSGETFILLISNKNSNINKPITIIVNDVKFTEYIKNIRIVIEDNKTRSIRIQTINDHDKEFQNLNSGNFSNVKIELNNTDHIIYTTSENIENGWIERAETKNNLIINLNKIIFAAVGDFDDYLDHDYQVFENIKETNANFILALGDLDYDENVSRWIGKIQNEFQELYPNNIFPVIGNHDERDKNGVKDLRDAFEILKTGGGEGYYEFEKENIKFIMMNSQEDFMAGSDQHQFVAEKLRAAKLNPLYDWIIVCYHWPSVYTKEDHHKAYKKFYKYYHKLFDENGVDLVLTGHNHCYMRTFPLKPLNYENGKAWKSVVVSDDDDEYNDVDGRVCVTIGTGGRKLRKNSEDKHVAQKYDKYDDDKITNGILVISLSENKKELLCEFKNNLREIKDRWIIRKS